MKDALNQAKSYTLSEVVYAALQAQIDKHGSVRGSDDAMSVVDTMSNDDFLTLISNGLEAMGLAAYPTTDTAVCWGKRVQIGSKLDKAARLREMYKTANDASSSAHTYATGYNAGLDAGAGLADQDALDAARWRFLTTNLQDLRGTKEARIGKFAIMCCIDRWRIQEYKDAAEFVQVIDNMMETCK